MPIGDPRFPPHFVGDPVDTLTGALVERKLEFRLVGPLELSWWRHYDSGQAGNRFALGWGHTHDFDRILYLAESGPIYGHPVGQRIGFSPIAADGEESLAAGWTLRRRSPRCYEMHRRGALSMEFLFEPGAVRARPRRLFSPLGDIILMHDRARRLEHIVHSTGATLSITHDGEGRLARILLAEAGRPASELLTYTYDQAGNLTETANHEGHGYRFGYDEHNRLIKRHGRKGFCFRYRYDEAGRCVFSAGDHNWYGVALTYHEGGRATSVRRPDGGVWIYRFFPNGKLSEIRDPEGGISRFLYDEAGRLSHEVDAAGDAGVIRYDLAGTALRREMPGGHAVALPETGRERTPQNHRVATNAAEYGFGRSLEVDGIRLPSRGQAAALGLPADATAVVVLRADGVPGDGPPFDIRPLGANWWPAPDHGRVFNEFGKLVAQIDDLGRKRHWAYDEAGNVACFTDFDGSQWRSDYGSWHLLRSSTSPIGARVALTYNSNEQVTRCVDPLGNVSDYGYDLCDRLVEVRRHGVVRERYEHNTAGAMVGKFGADGRLLMRREVGAGKRVTQRRFADEQVHTFRFDENGQCVSAESPDARIACRYDCLGNCVEETRDDLGVSHVFTAWRKPSRTTWFGRFAVEIERPCAGTVTVIAPTGGRQTIVQHGHGIVSRQTAAGTFEVAQYDPLGRCLFKHARLARGGHWTRRYHWSGEGELRQVEDSRFGETRHQYDLAHRLVGRTAATGADHFVLDLAGNLLTQPGLARVSMREGNRVAEANGARFEHNDRNHLWRVSGPGGVTEYHYDGRDQLTRVSAPGGDWTATYDALGRRVRKNFAQRSVEFWWHGDQLIAERTQDGAIRLYLYADLLALVPTMFIDYAAIDAEPDSGRLYSVFTDQIGAPVSIEDAAGREVWRAVVAPYGAADIAAGALVECAIRLPGQYADPEIGLHYNRFRHYSPLLGSYLQSDPWGIAGGTNLYAYPRNPLLAADVRGFGEEETSEPKPPEQDKEKLSAGARLARERGMPEPPEGYHYVDVGGEPRVRRNPGTSDDSPKMVYNPDTGQFDTVPDDDPYRRVTHSQESRDKVFDASQGDDGVTRCPCGEPIASSSSDDMDMGHTPEHKFSTEHDQAVRDGTSPSEFRDQQKDLSKYRAEHPSCNRSHANE